VKKAIVIANTKWFVLNFKAWLIKELSKNYKVEILFLNEGPKIKSSKLFEANHIEFKKINFSYFLKNLINQKSPEIILSFTIFGIFITPFLYPFTSKKIATIEGFGRIFSSRNLIPRFLKRLVLIYYKLVFNLFFDKIIVLNYSDLGYLLDLQIITIKKVRYIPGTGIDTELFSRKNMRNRNNKSNEINIGMISRYVIEKGFNKFIASKISLLNQLANTNSVINYILIFPKNDIKKITLEDIKYLESLNIKIKEYNENPLSIYEELDIIVQPTNYFEGLSRVILEAGSLEIPIVTFKNRGINDIIPNRKFGYIINNKSSPLSIALEIKKIINNPKKAKIKSNLLRKHIKTNFNTALVSRKFIDLLK
tara:strand:- start:2080 stop:3177 length:1098 start_codon:yes stop_codon:yes gene_type:complete